MSKKNQKMDASFLAPLPPKINLRDVEILEKALKANIALAELNGLVHSIPNFEILLAPLTAREAVASSEIESIYTTTLDILQAELFPEEKLPKEQKETLSYKQALLAGYQSVLSKEFISTNQLVEIQKILEPSKAGIRKLPGTVIVNGMGEVIYTPPQGEALLRALLKNWEEYCNDPSKVDTLVRAAILHYQFESIHPFYDGNGRTGRILMVLQLVLEKRLRFPVLFLSGYILKTKRRYYELLQKVRTENLWKEWIVYILEGIEKQSLETSERILAIKNLVEETKHPLTIDGRPTKGWFAKTISGDILDYWFSRAFYSQKDMVKTLGINRKTASKYLDGFHKMGFLKMKIVKKQKIYFNPKFIRLLS
ncbi:Fic family protein [Candidatus Peregrinibacteria bacterium]|nr:MAG: Fic family protein [Candidatus Peregrinibacteria bacterium]